MVHSVMRIKIKFWSLFCWILLPLFRCSGKIHIPSQRSEWTHAFRIVVMFVFERSNAPLDRERESKMWRSNWVVRKSYKISNVFFFLNTILDWNCCDFRITLSNWIARLIDFCLPGNVGFCSSRFKKNIEILIKIKKIK